MKRTLAIIGLLGSFAIPSFASTAADATTTCTSHKVAVTKTVKVQEHVKVKGKTVTKTVSKRVDVRHNVKVKQAYKVRVKGKLVTRYRIVVKSEIKYRTVQTCTTTGAVTAVLGSSGKAVSTSSSATGNARASIDPSYTQDQGNPLKVTFSYSASETDGNLPNGVLDLYWGPSTQSQTLACSLNVGGNVTGGDCTVVFPAYGQEAVTVQYVSGTTSATQTDTEDIENPNPTPAAPAATSTGLAATFQSFDPYPTNPDGEHVQLSTIIISNSRTIQPVGGAISFSLLDGTTTIGTWTSADVMGKCLLTIEGGQSSNSAFAVADGSECSGPQKSMTFSQFDDVIEGNAHLVASFAGSSSFAASTSVPVFTQIPS